jgi:SAM-dependent methyltransferase
VIRFLERVVAEDPPKPDQTGAEHPMRKVTRQVAFDVDGWTKERAGKVAALFDGLAPEWHEHANDPQRTAPLDDAYARGGVPRGGRCLEVGSGTGANTVFLAGHHETVVAADLAMEMLRRAPSDVGYRVRADTSNTPVASGSIHVAVLANALLVPSEMDRVLSPRGALVWVNTAGDLTPIHLSAEDVVAAMPGGWDAVASEAGWGTWAVLTRA